MDTKFIPVQDLLEIYGENKVRGILQTYHDCNGSEQESFLREDAIMMEKKNMCRTYLAMDGGNAITGYFSIGLRCMEIPKSEDDKKDFRKKMNIDVSSRVAQAYLIGQLSRSASSPKGFGQVLMKEALGRIMKANRIVGCRLVRVDCADKLVDYYSEYGFRYIKKNKDGDLNQMAYVLRPNDADANRAS